MSPELEQLYEHLSAAGLPIADVSKAVALLGFDRKWRVLPRPRAAQALADVGLAVLASALPDPVAGELATVELGSTLRVGALVMHQPPRGDA